jgi:hypothetical protein
MLQVFNVNCMMCGRTSGHIRNRRFLKLPSAPVPVIRGGKSRCGFCGGNIYLEAEDSPMVVHHNEAAMAQQARRAS